MVRYLADQCNTWSYHPYCPILGNVGDIYICRVVPYADKIHFEWLGSGDGEYEVFYRKRGEDDFIRYGKVTGAACDIEGLEAENEYEFFVSADQKRSRIRLARCAEPVGSVVNYLHPEDGAYLFSGRYLCSPSLVRHPDGYLLASMDVFEGACPQNLTLIFRSDDNGESWHDVSELMPSFWGKMFIHKGELYMLSCSTEYGDLLIGKSTDGGKTFSTPTVLLRGSNGKNHQCGVHKNPQNVMRYAIVEGDPPYGLVLAYRVNTDDPDAPLEYSHSIRMPCNNSKFMIKYDEVSCRYYSIVTRIDCYERRHRRPLLSLMTSKDMENWTLVCDLLDGRNLDIEKVGFQYVDFEFEGEDIIYLCRTAWNNAEGFHDSNYSTFHTIKNFRSL